VTLRKVSKSAKGESDSLLTSISRFNSKMPSNNPEEETYLFLVEYFDPLPRLKRQYLLKLFVKEMDVEMVDLKSKKLFLKRSPVPEHVKRSDFFVGGNVLLYSRMLDIVEYGDGYTRKKLATAMEPAVILAPASTQAMWGNLIETAGAKGMTVAAAKTVLFGPAQINEVQATLGSSEGLNDPAGVLVLHLAGPDGVAIASEALEASGLGGSALISPSTAVAEDLKGLLLGPKADMESSVTLDSCTCCIIKPHAVREGLIGPILTHLSKQSYEISALSTLHFGTETAEEFLEVYKGVVPEYSDHVVELCGGMCVAIELRAQDAVRTFRQTAGPWDVEMARELRPNTIRGMYGVDKVRNVVHCTDLDTDAIAECEYVFKLVQ
jgi:nucleoside-diphosphate kinase